MQLGSDDHSAPSPVLELVAQRVLPTAVRGTAPGEGPLTYRKALDDVIPGQAIALRERKRWRFRRTTMVGGPLLRIGFSLRALQVAGFELPHRGECGALRDPASEDERLRDGLLELESDDWLAARCLLLDVLEDRPGSLSAHAALGHVHAALRRSALALAHYTAAVRLGLAALGPAPGPALGASTEGQCLLTALGGRAALLERLGRPLAAAADLRRALACDPDDRIGAGRRLARLHAAADGAPAGPQGREPQRGGRDASG